MRRLKLCLSACLLGFAAPAFAGAPHYKITILEAFGNDAAAGGVNSQGQVVGWAANADYSAVYGVVWDHGIVQAVTPGSYGYLAGINEAGASVGQISTPTSSSSSSVLFANGVMSAYDYASPGYSSFFAINDQGGAVGEAMIDDQGEVFHATSLVNGQLVDLGVLGGNRSAANGINNAGLIAGSSEYDGGDGNSHAVTWDANGIHDLGTMAGVFSAAYGLNDAGVIVGETTFSDAYPDTTHAFALHDGAWTDLGALNGPAVSSAAWAINAGGQIVGASGLTPGDVTNLHAMLWQDGQMFDLNDLIAPNSGWLLQGATAISANGLIVGYGLFDGHRRAFLLEADGSVPEPASWALMLIGFGAVGAGMRRRAHAPACD